VGGAAIIIEHRYWGESSPFYNLTVKNLQYLTISQSIQDMVYFAENVVLPFDITGKSNAHNAPWVFVGGSYSGALAAWTEITSPRTFWAYHASSAPIQSIKDFVGTRSISPLRADHGSGSIITLFNREWRQIVARTFKLL
jgi:hypothetical protein